MATSLAPQAPTKPAETETRAVLQDMSITEFSDVLASNAPAPGGGSVAALSGMLGADLVAMVCRLTIDKAGYEEHREALSEVLASVLPLSDSLRQRIDLDTEAFNEVMAAFKLPKESDEDKKARSAAIQQGYKSAIQSPLGIARECTEVLRLAQRMIGKANTNAISDLGVAAQQAYAGLEGAIMNVKINIPSIKDGGFVEATQGEVTRLREDARRAAQSVHSWVTEQIG